MNGRTMPVVGRRPALFVPADGGGNSNGTSSKGLDRRVKSGSVSASKHPPAGLRFAGHLELNSIGIPMNRSASSLIVLLFLALPLPRALHAQSDDSESSGEPVLAGVDRIGIYTGANVGFQVIEARVLPLPPGGNAPANSPVGIGASYGLVYSR